MPDDEDIESGYRDDPDKEQEAGSRSSTMSAVLMLCCCVVVLAIIGIILGVVVFKDDDPEVGPAAAALVAATPTSAPFVTLPAPTESPFMNAIFGPTPTTAAPSEPIPEVVIIRPGADTYITSGAVNHGAEDILLVQNGVGGNDVAVSLVSFDIENITSLPDSVLDGRVETATIIFTLKPDADTTSSSDISMIQVARLPSTPVSIEDLGNDDFEQPANKTIGSIFEVPSNATTVSADVTDFLFGQTDVVILRRLTTQEKQLLLVLENRGTLQSQSVQFYSRESDFPPQLVIRLKKRTESPTVSPAPSVSSKPSSRPSTSSAASLSGKPSLRSSTAPSAKPSLSQNPTYSPTTSTAPSASTKPTASSDVPSNSTLPSNVNMTMPPAPPGNGTFTLICNICGEGNKIGNLEGVVVLPSQDSRTCNEYQPGDDSGLMSEAECAEIQALNIPCECESEGNMTRPPMEGNMTRPPIEGNMTRPPMEGNMTMPPMEGNMTRPPMEGNMTRPPIEGNMTRPPMEGNMTMPPMEGNMTRPPMEGNMTRPPMEGNMTRPPMEGNMTRPPIEGNMTRPPMEGNMTRPPMEGNVTRPPMEGNVTRPPMQGNMTRPPMEGNMTRPPMEGNMTRPPMEGNTTMPPMEGKKTRPPMEGNMTIPPMPGDGMGTFICNICGEGMKIGDLAGVMTVPAQDDRTCQEYQLGGDGGQIGETECAKTQAFNAPCECEIAL
jgi:hypothetical protein